MKKVLIYLPDELAQRTRVVIPGRQRSNVVASLLEKEVKQREKALYECACAVKADDTMQKEIAEWEITSGDGINNETW